MKLIRAVAVAALLVLSFVPVSVAAASGESCLPFGPDGYRICVDVEGPQVRAIFWEVVYPKSPDYYVEQCNLAGASCTYEPPSYSVTPPIGPWVPANTSHTYRACADYVSGNHLISACSAVVAG